MTNPKLDYRWNLRQVMAQREMFSTTDLLAPLEVRGIKLSTSQVYRLVVERPERLSLKILMALLDILDCTMEELIEPIGTPATAKKTRAAGGDSPIGALRPKRARIIGPKTK
ncbi:MAG: helix-turn-helix domain-containing protein [Acidimicrobiales bacterium]